MEPAFPRAAIDQSIGERFEQQVAQHAARMAVKTPAHPPASLARMLEGSTAGLIITNAEMPTRLRACAPEASDALAGDELAERLPTDNPVVPLSPDALPSIMYWMGVGEARGAGDPT